MKGNGGPFSYDTNPDSVSPEKLQQVIRTQEGDYPRLRMERGGSMFQRNQMADRGVRRAHGDDGTYGLARISDFFLAAGGAFDRPYSPGSVPFGKASYSYGPGGGLPGWSMTDITPSDRPGYSRREFSNSAAFPEPDYPGMVTRSDWEKGSGAFANPALDFPLNQARSYFEGNPGGTAVRLGRANQLLTGESLGVNPSYPLTRRYDEYKEAPVTLPTAHLMSLPGIGLHSFSIPSPEKTLTQAPSRPVRNSSRLIHTPEGFDYKHNRPASGSITMRDLGGLLQEFGKGGKWIQGAVNPAHKGWCTPMTKSTCTGRRRAFALTMKKHHGFHEQGGKLKSKCMGGAMKYSKPRT